MSKNQKDTVQNYIVTLNEIDTLNPLSLDFLDTTQCNSQKDLLNLLSLIVSNVEFDTVELLFNSLDIHNIVEIPKGIHSQKSIWINREYTQRAMFTKKEFDISNGKISFGKNSYMDITKLIEFKYDCFKFTLKGKTVLCVTVHNGYLVSFNVELHNQRANEYKLKNSKSTKLNEFELLLKELNIDTKKIDISKIDKQSLIKSLNQ